MIKRSFIIIAALVLAAATAGCAAGPQEYVTILAPMATQASETAAPVESTPMSTPTAEPTSEPTPEPTSEVQEATVGFVGDILMMTRQIADAKTETGYDFTESFLPMKSVFESVDIMCADFEGTFGGEDGLDFYRRIARDYAQRLNDGGALALEVGIYQAKEVAKMLGGARIVKDVCGIERAVIKE